MSNFVLNLVKNVILLCMVFSRVNKSKSYDYCDMDCKGIKHTICQYPAGGGDQCSNNEKVYLMVKEKRLILEFHNNMRENVANGKELRGIKGEKQPSAGNMMKLVWDGELSLFAKRWADQCKEGLHDVCRKTMDGFQVGQNSYVGTYDESDNKAKSRNNRMQQVLNTWYDEVENMDPGEILSFNTSSSNKTSNYTQIVWGNTIYIGCGYTEFKLSGGLVLFRFICDYKRRGNVPFDRVYRKGPPCSSCPPKTNCSVTWPGLCWNGEENEFLDMNSACQHKTSFLGFALFYTIITLVSRCSIFYFDSPKE